MAQRAAQTGVLVRAIGCRSIDDHAAKKPRVIWRETSAHFFSRMDHAKPWLSNGTVCEQRDTANTLNHITDPLLSHSSSIRVLRTWRLSDAAGGGAIKGYSRVGGGRMALDCTHLCMPSTVLDRWNVCLFKGLDGGSRSRLAARR